MLLLDNSAWVRLNSPRLEAGRREQIAADLEAGELAVCVSFLLETGYSAQSGVGHADMLGRLTALPWVRVDAAIEASALRAQAELARSGHHRVAPADLLIAACAHHIGAGVLHYDQTSTSSRPGHRCASPANG